MYIIGVALSLFSITLIYKEFNIHESFEFNSPMEWVKLDSGYILIQIECVIPLTYLAFCVFYGMFKLKITGFYGIYPN